MVTHGCFASRAQACASESVVVIGSMRLGFLADAGPGVAGQNITGKRLGGTLQTGSTDSPETLVSFYNPPGNGSPDEAARSPAQSGKGAPDYAPAEQALHPGYGCPRTRGMWMNSHGLGISPTGTSITL